MLKYKNDFKHKKFHTFWRELDVCLKQRGIIKQPTTTEQLIEKWSNLVKSYARARADPNISEHNSTTFPFMHEMNEILPDPINPQGSIINIGSTSIRQMIKATTLTDNSKDQGFYINTNSRRGSLKISKKKESFKETNIPKHQNSWQLVEWFTEDTRTFLKCLLQYKHEFFNIPKRKKIVFWQKIVDCLKREGSMIQLPTADQLQNKWKSLVKTYQRVTSKLVNEEQFPFLDEMKEILIDSLNSDILALSIGLKTTCNSANEESINNFSSINDHDDAMISKLDNKPTDISSESSHNKKEPIIINDTSFNHNLKAEIVELKHIYLQKKIEGRELKNELLTRLLNDPNCYAITTGFRVVKANQSHS